MRTTMLILGIVLAVALAVWLMDAGAESSDVDGPEAPRVEDTTRQPGLATTAYVGPTDEEREMLTAPPPPEPPARLVKAWTVALSLHAAGRTSRALRILAALREEFPAYFADPHRAKLLKEMEAKAKADQDVVQVGAIEQLVRDARRRKLTEMPDETAFERALRLSANAAADHRNRKDRDQVVRHLRRFLMGQTDGARRQTNWVDGPLGTLAKLRAARKKTEDKGARDADPLPLKDPEEVEKRRIDQLEKLRSRNATGLLDHIHAGLAWLALHQGADGRFSDVAVLDQLEKREGEELGQQFEAHLKRYAERFTVPATALAVMAFLDFRDQDVVGLFEPTLANAVDWLLEQQKEDGSFPGGRPYYTDAIVLMAIGQAAAATGEERIKAAVKTGLATLYERSGPNGGYRYGKNQAGDISVSGWVAQALEMAALAEIETPERMRDDLENFLRGVWIEDHQFAYLAGGVGSGSPGARPTLFPVGMLMGHILWEEVPELTLKRWRHYLKQPNPHAARLYTMYYGVRMSILLEGAMIDPWRKAVLDWTKKQATKGPLTGAFGGQGIHGGVTLQTAFSVLTLEHALFLR